MRTILTFFALVLFSASSYAVTHEKAWQDVVVEHAELSALNTKASALDMNAFLDLSPKKFRELTGERLGVKGALALKVAQKNIKKMSKARNGNRAEDIPKGLYIVAVLLGWGWLAMGLMDDFDGNNWWVNLLLVLFTCGIGGLIHGFVKMKEYY